VKFYRTSGIFASFLLYSPVSSFLVYMRFVEFSPVAIRDCQLAFTACLRKTGLKNELQPRCIARFCLFSRNADSELYIVHWMQTKVWVRVRKSLNSKRPGVQWCKSMKSYFEKTLNPVWNVDPESCKPGSSSILEWKLKPGDCNLWTHFNILRFMYKSIILLSIIRDSRIAIGTSRTNGFRKVCERKQGSNYRFPIF
jgi:hypothetical protein